MNRVLTYMLIGMLVMSVVTPVQLHRCNAFENDSLGKIVGFHIALAAMWPVVLLTVFLMGNGPQCATKPLT